MERTVDVDDTRSSCSVEGELLDYPETKESQQTDCKERAPILRKIIAIKDSVVQVLLKSVMYAMLTDLVVVLSIIVKTTFWVIVKAFFTMIAVPAKSTRNYFENERALIMGATSEVGRETALKLARYGINRIILWDTNAEQLKEVVEKIKDVKSNTTKIFTYTIPSFNKESIEDTITKMKLEAGDVSLLVNAIDSNSNINEKILTADTNSLLNIIQQELTMYTLVRCDYIFQLPY